MMTVEVFSETRLGLPSLAYRFENQGPEILILGGVHGDEVEGVAAARSLLNHLMKKNPYKLNLTIVPEFNIDGVLLGTRMNFKKVDLNRNLPTKDWSPEAKTERYHPGSGPLSEPENKGLVDFIEKRKPRFILSLHSWKPMINVNGACDEEAEVLHRMTGYRIDPDIGYPTPGSLGTYSGHEKKIPTITYEIQEGMPLDEVVKMHTPALLEMLKVCEKKYV